jgi:hypothetical protein
MSLNPQVQIAHHRMELSKSTMPNWQSALKHCYLVWVSLQSIGRQRWCIWCIYTTDLSTTLPAKPLFEAYFGVKPDLSCSKLFGSWVCVKRSGSRCSKLDQHNFKGLFLGYTATDQNIIYLDLDSGVVKASHHTQFDEAWYLQPSHPPAAQLLYDLGILPECNAPSEFADESEVVTSNFWTPGSIEKVLILWPPTTVDKGDSKWIAPDWSILQHLPLCTLTHDLPRPITAKAAHTKPLSRRNIAAELVKKFNIGSHDMAMVYMSPDPYHEAFEQTLDLRKFNFSHHPTAGLSLFEQNGRVHLGTISLSTPAAKLHEWRSRVCGAWLIKVGGITVNSLDDVNKAFHGLDANKTPSATLLFMHPEI